MAERSATILRWLDRPAASVIGRALAVVVVVQIAAAVGLSSVAAALAPDAARSAAMAPAEGVSTGPTPVASFGNYSKGGRGGGGPKLLFKFKPGLLLKPNAGKGPTRGCSYRARRAGLCGGRPGGNAKPGIIIKPPAGGPNKWPTRCIGGKAVGAACVCGGGAKPVRSGGRTWRCAYPPKIEPCPPGRHRVGRSCIPVIKPDPTPICVGGRRSGGACTCPYGTKPVSTGRLTRCVAEPCPPGKTRVGRRCVGSSAGDTTPSCIGGRISGDACHCPSGTYPSKLGRYVTRCVFEPCPDGRRRIGKLCIAINVPPPVLPLPPLPPSRTAEQPQSGCPAGWRRDRHGECRLAGEAECPAGTRRSGGACIAVAGTPDFVPPAPPVRPGPPLPNRANTITANDTQVPDEVLVEISGSPADAIASRLVAAYSLQQLSSRRIATLGTNLYRFRVPRGQSVPAIVTALATEAGVESAQPNFIYRLNADAPDHSVRDQQLQQYAIEAIKSRQAHRITRGQDVRIAIIDTSIDTSHPELSGVVAERFDAFDDAQSEPDDHGTAIAGIISAHQMLQGVAPDARLLAATAFKRNEEGGSGDGTSERVIASVDWALQNKARVVNMSFEGVEDRLLGSLIATGDGEGVVFIAAAGNGGPNARPAFPASHPDVISVTAVDDTSAVYTHANVGGYIDVAAPGVDVLVPTAGGAYDMRSGTSFAAAHVSGVAALMLAVSPRMGKARLLRQLKATSKDLGHPGRDDVFGAGEVDALRALVDRTAVAGGD